MQDPIFPNASVHAIKLTSAATSEYNCISWALHVENQVIWPDEDEQFSWPVDIARCEKLEAFRTLFEQVGFSVCEDGALERGFEKVAIYEKNDLVQHCARLKISGLWTSKLGDAADISHPDVATLESPAYGTVALYMRRPFNGLPPTLPKLHPGPARLVTSTGIRLL